MKGRQRYLCQTSNVAISFVMSCALIMLTCLPALPAQPAEAATGDTVQLNVGGSISYDNYNTHWMDVDGAPAYCAQPDMNTPQSGTYARGALSTAPDGGTVEQLAAGIYYGYGGPGFEQAKQYFPSTWYDGTPMNDERYAALTHIVLADIYGCDGQLALNGTSDGFKDWACWNVIGYSHENGSSLNPNATRRVLADVGGTLPAPPAGFTDACFTLTTGGGSQNIVGYVPQGQISIQKQSSEQAISSSNSAYSLQGAVYGIYSDQACTNQVATMTTDAQGYAKSDPLSLGTYFVKELTASYGFTLDTQVKSATVTSGQTASVSSSETPNYSTPDLLIKKINKETETPNPVAGAEFAGAEFSVAFTPAGGAKATKTWLFKANDKGELHFNADSRIGGDQLFTNSSGAPVLPIGHYSITETKAPAGYLVMDGEQSFDIQDTSNTDTAPELAFNEELVAKEQVQRGDFQFRKVDGNQKNLAGIPFLVTYNNGEEGDLKESHVIVTDENGEFNSASATNSHFTKTNVNDSAVHGNESGGYTVAEDMLDPHSGLWFSMDKSGATAQPNDAKGALPYGSYTLTELPCSKNAKMNLVTLEFTVYRDQTMVELNNIVDTEPTIGTTASDKTDGDDVVEPVEDVSLIDVVDYNGLIAGTEYTMHGTLMVKETGAALTDKDDNVISAETTFTPTSSSGTVKMEFKLDASKLAGKTLVVFESLLENGKTIASHEDLDSTSQSVHVGPALHTTAVDKADADKQISGDGAIVQDTVKYNGLAPKTSYTMKGTLMDKTTGQAVTNADGSEINTSVEFETEDQEGEVSIELPVNASTLTGHDLVVFEKCLDDKGEPVTTHEDFNAQSQTVHVVDQAQPEQETTVSEQGGYDKTGVNFLGLIFFAGLLGVLGASLTAISAHRRKVEEGKHFDFGRD